MKWVKENIAAFGGDPDQITVLGFESGATSILMLAASGQAKDLFRKAFVFNGNPLLVYDTPEGARALAKSLMKETQTETMQDLARLDSESLKEAAQRLWQGMCAPTCDGTWIPADLYRAFQDGAASGIEFIIGIPRDEMNVLRSFMGNQNYEDVIAIAMSGLQNNMGESIANAVQAYLKEQSAVSTELEAKTKLLGQILALYIYLTAVKLSEGGNPVHLLYWGEKPLIENLGSGTVDAAAALLGNSDALQMYGSVMNGDLSEALQALLIKYMNGKELTLYTNEIKGVDAFTWKAFPKALVVSDGKLQCDTIEDRITDIKELKDFVSVR